MKDYKIVNALGNDATPRQVFGYVAYQLMEVKIRQLMERGKVSVNGIPFIMDEGAKEKLEGMLSHIQNRWDAPVRPEKIVRKTAELDVSFDD